MNGCHAAKVSLTGSQPLSQTKLIPNSWIAGHAPSKTFQTIAGDDQQREERGAGGQDVQRRIADAVADVARPAQDG